MATPYQSTSADSNQEGVLVAEQQRRPGFVKYAIYYFRHKPMGTLGLAIVLSMMLIAIFAPLIAPYTYQEQNYANLKHAPSAEFFFGTRR